MTIFDYLNSILFLKDKLELNCDDESQFSVFMVNRWSSFYSKEIAEYINQTSNTYAGIYTSKQEQYNFLYNVIPKIKFKRLNYVKKTKKEDKDEEAVIIPEFYSEREYKNNVEFEKTITK